MRATAAQDGRQSPGRYGQGCSFVARVLQVRGGEAMREAGIEFGALPPR